MEVHRTICCLSCTVAPSPVEDTQTTITTHGRHQFTESGIQLNKFSPKY